MKKIQYSTIIFLIVAIVVYVYLIMEENFSYIERFGIFSTIGGIVLLRNLLRSKYFNICVILICTISICVSSINMIYIWEPFLSQYYNITGWFTSFDPARIYIYSRELVINDFKPKVYWDFSGVFYFYGVFMYFLTFEPFAIVIVNYYCLILVIFHFIKTLELLQFPVPRGNYGSIFIILLLPEVVYYMSMPSKDIALLICLTLFISLVLRYFFVQKSVIGLFIIMSLIVLTSSIRGAAILMLVIGIVIPYLVVQVSWNRRILVLFKMLVIAIIGIYGLYHILPLNYIEYLTLKNSTGIMNSNTKFTSNSIAQLLLTDSIIMKIIYVPLRNIFLIIAPLANWPTNLWTFTSYEPWLRLSTFISSLFYLIFVPFMLAFFHDVLLKRRNKAVLAFTLIVIIWYTIIANGVQLFHPRYRIMISIMIFVCILGGYCSSRNLLSFYMGLWIVLLILGSLFYMGYKIM